MENYIYSTILKALDEKASDIHIKEDHVPAVRIDGSLKYYNEKEVTRSEILHFLKNAVSDKIEERLKEESNVDCAFQIGENRFRLNTFISVGKIAMAIRALRGTVPLLADLEISSPLDSFLDLKEGLVLVTGPTGSGKSTTLAALINELNQRKNLHIITIEDPIEYIHHNKNCYINQRELGSDCLSFAQSLKSALRQDPDVILVGEMRDLESIEIALRAAETGHLVFSTLHTMGASKTIDRLLDSFESSAQKQVRSQISTSLKGVISQKLMPKVGGGRMCAVEIMKQNNAISNLIREGKTVNINQQIELSFGNGMITMAKTMENLKLSGNVIMD